MENENDMETWDGIEDYDQWSEGLTMDIEYPEYEDPWLTTLPDDEEEGIGYA